MATAKQKAAVSKMMAAAHTPEARRKAALTRAKTLAAKAAAAGVRKQHISEAMKRSHAERRAAANGSGSAGGLQQVSASGGHQSDAVKAAARANIAKARKGASSPAARAKAVATLRRRRLEREAAVEIAAQGGTMLPLDLIPERQARKKYTRKPAAVAAGSIKQQLALGVVTLLNTLLKSDD